MGTTRCETQCVVALCQTDLRSCCDRAEPAENGSAVKQIVVSSSPHRKVSPEASDMRLSVQWMRRHLACICCLLLVALALGLGALTGYTGK